jgi:alpha-L-rhamnosidase
MDGLLGPDLVPHILDAGYNFDFIDDGAIAHGGVPYPILILPAVNRIPLSTYRKLAEYADRGGILVATGHAPSEAPGLMDTADTPRIAELSRKLHVVADIAGLTAVLHAEMPADVAAAPEIPAVHRKLDFAEIYFIVNTSNHSVRSPAAFRVKGLNAEWWDPMTGTATNAGGANLELSLAPYESRVLVFSREYAPADATAAGPTPAPVELNGPWKITFAGESQSITSTTLRSWTGDEAHKYFSGQATYETVVTVPTAMTVSGHPVYLDFGEGGLRRTRRHTARPVPFATESGFEQAPPLSA